VVLVSILAWCLGELMRMEGRSPAEAPRLSAELDSAPERTPLRSPPPRRLASAAPAIQIPPLLPIEPAREAAAAPLAGRVAGHARLTWTPTSEFEGLRSPGDLDHARLAALTVTTESADDGSFAFATTPEGAESGSAVWITAEGSEAASVSFDSASDGRWPKLEPIARAPARVRVTRAGEPVAGAVVRHTLSYWEGERDEAEKRVRRAFLRTGRTQDDGTLEFVPGPGSNAFLATLDEEISLLWIGEPEEEVELELHTTVLVSGLVVTDDPALDLSVARYNFGFAGADGLAHLEWPGASRFVRADGTFGPDPWPRLDLPTGVVRLSGGEVIPVFEQVDHDSNDDELVFVLHAERGMPFVVAVTDGEHEPLRGATASAYHWSNGNWTVAQQDTDENGLATVWVPPGELSLEVAKLGFTSESLLTVGSLVVPQTVTPARVVLHPAGVIEGWVHSGSEPVRAFEVCAWNRDQSYFRQLAFQDQEGAFRLADVPRGETIFLTAFTARDPQSATETLVLGEDPAEVELELPAARRAIGRVIDAVTQAPVTATRIQHLVSGMNAFAGYRGPMLSVAADGSFELDGVFPGRGGLAFMADGYEELFFSVREDDVEVLDIGLIALSPLAVLQVQARDDGVADFGGYRAWNDWNLNPCAQELDTGGRLEIPSRSGHFAVNVSRPDGVIARVAGNVRAGEHLEVPVDFADGIELAVTLAEVPRDVENWKCGAALRTGREERITRAPWSKEREAFVLPRLHPGPVTLELHDAEGALVALRTVRISEAEQQTVQLERGGQKHRLRLVNGRGEPWAARPVAVGLEEGTAWSSRLETDAQGELELGPLDAKRVRLFAKLGAESIAYGVPVVLEPLPATTVVTLDTGPRCLLRVHESGRPVAGIYVHFTHELAPLDMRFFYISDEAGLVRGPFLASDEHRISINHPDYWPLEQPVQPSPGAESFPVELRRRATLVFEVERGGQSVPGARFELRHAELGQEVAEWLAEGLLAGTLELVTASDGRLELAGVPRGTYHWTCTDSDGASTSGTFALAGGTVERLPVRLPPR
jgi:hypothetical protein